MLDLDHKFLRYEYLCCVQNGDGYVDTEAKEERIIAGIKDALSTK